MNGEEVDALIRAVVTLSGTIGLVWFAVRLAIHYQEDFTDRYARRVDEQDKRIDEMEAELSAMSSTLRNCRESEAHLRLHLIRAGIDIPPPEPKP